MVCPKLRMRRRPPSRSSLVTTSALMRHDSTIAGTSTAGVARQHRLGLARQQVEEVAAGDHAVFHHLVEPRAELAPRQRGQRQRVGHDQHRLVERADQVLAERVVDADLAADRAVHLRQQRRRHVHEGDAAQEARRGKAGRVADDAAADGDRRRCRGRRRP